MFFQHYYQKIFFRIQNLQLYFKKTNIERFRKISKDFERKFLMKNPMISKDFAKMKSTFYSFFKFAKTMKFMFFEVFQSCKKWKSCFLRFFKLAKNAIHVFWCSLSLQKIKFIFFEVFKLAKKMKFTFFEVF